MPAVPGRDPAVRPGLRRLQRKNVGFVGIDIKEAGRGAPRAFVKDNKIHYPIVYDELGETALRLGNIPTQGVPFTVILDKQHRVAARLPAAARGRTTSSRS